MVKAKKDQRHDGTGHQEAAVKIWLPGSIRMFCSGSALFVAAVLLLIAAIVVGCLTGGNKTNLDFLFLVLVFGLGFALGLISRHLEARQRDGRIRFLEDRIDQMAKAKDKMTDLILKKRLSSKGIQ